MHKTLYEQDYYLWIEKTISLLKNHQFSDLDLDNLIEEIKSMGIKEKHTLTSLLTRIIQHLLQLAYWESERQYNANHWKGEITIFRIDLWEVLDDNPSLKSYLENNFDKCYQSALRILARKMGVKINTLPTEKILTLAQALDDDWFPEYEDDNN
ncbi:MAG: DUF29 domain-containing protein [Microcystis novacekii Mn_MB_F_20050700_S1]|uniref:DUF29 domain-containing protein n=1 Tax=Microcystis novacekii Mn_MB_F_20050700_S1D TaxID=2486266 RepID=A0A552J8X2_9CHRO|nr:MAG: DUF29 domain-containing protein [Microcystis novacekii Mn_MB_F_20050700_S1]TRU92179.1 MAG: DUF29 domain-containing protein [Microcystis novacekii Mn_MB_F_20050700_S1D]